MADVLTRIEGGVGRITLNRPRSLNALTLAMVEEMAATLAAWETDPAVRFILVDGAGDRGLCAGGDIRAVYDASRAGDFSANEAFFRAEYQLNAQIAHFGKPYIVLMDGIVMGGGVGIASHGSHRIVTERSRVAMPETGIGFFPDIGATWLLSRAPGELGTHMGLTGEAIGAADAILSGLADMHIASAALPDLVETLLDCDATGLAACLEGFSTTPQPGLFAEARDWITACYAGDDITAIITALAAHESPMAQQAAEIIGRRSPMSLMLTLHALRTAATLGSLEACLDREFRMALIRTSQHDFIEGVRAAVIDKDRNPRWVPARLDKVGGDDVAALLAAAESKPALWP